MRRTDILIAGGGPAGSAAAITFARAGRRPLLVDRHAGPHDTVCGGFVGWDVLRLLAELGVDAAALGARPIDRLRLVVPGRIAEVALPYRAAGLSRRTLDEAMIRRAGDVGAQILRGARIAEASATRIRIDRGDMWEGRDLFVATGKHELRGQSRALDGRALSIGLRTALPPDPALEGVIELHLLDSGYCGLLTVDDGTVNCCLSLETAQLAAIGDKTRIPSWLAEQSPLLGQRLAGFTGNWDAIANVPYGWRAQAGEPHVWRIGDQAAVVASLAGDGIAIALASGSGAAKAYCDGRTAPDWQAGFARQAARPLAVAELLRSSSQNPRRQRALVALAHWSPPLARLAARLTRIA